MQNMYMLPFRGLAITACHPAARAKDHSKTLVIYIYMKPELGMYIYIYMFIVIYLTPELGMYIYIYMFKVIYIYIFIHIYIYIYLKSELGM